MALRQGEKETLRDYIKRFNNEVVTIPNLQQEIAMLALIGGLEEGTFKSYLGRKSFTTLGVVLGKENDYIRGEELTKASASKYKAEASHTIDKEREEDRKDYRRDAPSKKDDACGTQQDGIRQDAKKPNIAITPP